MWPLVENVLSLCSDREGSVAVKSGSAALQYLQWTGPTVAYILISCLHKCQMKWVDGY